ncbi:tRNA (guanosine(37)-N1)-methyltransferase TrmD [Candidatus Pandoraea novymonadis]|uniref:tRNA (guanine-N(1)-)-methyltransferase n=1 Tax=Candidatus Pandoraea novymonadis TaxID=1808959 RepID=A0ABX5FEL0_9BURK|nr:tRNA (guanosine(37)-N1)-methyltransferase TrmD [Candidatus Pandoraea novymonadis]PSB92096.1 tRNA (guanine-N(1)-)-methyltransferase [Candidatus Pandoraea novymonadis]
MQFDVITLFPEMFQAITHWGVTGRALKKAKYVLRTWNPRDFTNDSYRTIDDRPYGGGPGMVMLAQPLEAAIVTAKVAQVQKGVAKPRVLFMSPQGKPLSHRRIMDFQKHEQGLIILCGRYEAVDQRLIDRCVDEEVSVGDFVLSGGELPAMVLMDSLIRQLPGTLNDSESNKLDSFVEGLLDFTHYTRPEEYEGLQVPKILLSGHHAEIEKWRRRDALANTWRKRPDLLEMVRQNGLLNSADEAWLASLKIEVN